ncbi:MAG: DUF2834 domain-containing protein [Proteobacteria bacterium]|nr:DUF2834 domain-containing protein [Pseudomonadota bacterium]
MLKNWKALLLGLVIIDFASLTVWAAMNQGIGETFAVIAANPWMTQVSLDLCVAVAFGLTFLWRDARKNDINPVPYVVLSLFLGSIGLLSYGVRRLWVSSEAPAPVGATPVRA